MQKVTIIGKYNMLTIAADGQSVKTRIVTQELEKIIGIDQIRKIDTCGWKKNPLKLFARSFIAVQKSDNVVFMTDAGGIKVFPWLLLGANIFHKSSLHYVVVGAWLVKYLEKHKFISACLKRFRAIYVETLVLKNGLENLGFNNVYLMANFKQLSVLSEKHLVFNTEPYKFCTFSRVMEEKGIAEAVEAVQEVNNHYGRTVCMLDIYGQVDPDQVEWFENLRKEFPPGVQYCGLIPYEKSVEVIKNYFAVLFPTKFYTEGIPGTIIDAYAAGVPVIASRWESFEEVIEVGKTGLGYNFEEPENLKSILLELVESPEIIYSMKKNCLVSATRYLPESSMDVLISKLSL